MNREVKVINSNPNEIRKAIESVGNLIGSVAFRKRGNGKLRKMSYRLHVKNPSNPLSLHKGNSKKCSGIDIDNCQMTVYDVNKTTKVIKKDVEIRGRGAWRTIPLESVESVVAKGTIYLIRGRYTCQFPDLQMHMINKY